MFNEFFLNRRAEKQVKAFAALGLLHEFGFTVKENKVKVIKSYTCNGRPKYVLFGVNGHIYSYDGESVEKDVKELREEY